jgi:hypothetical protein
VLVTGGLSDASPPFLTETDVFLAASGTWTTTQPLPTGHATGPGVALLGGEVLVVGGDDPSGSPIPSAYLFTESPPGSGTGSWASAGTPTIARYAPSIAVLSSGRVLLAGGDDNGCCSGPAGTYATAELYDAAAGTWTPTGSMSVSRFGATATLLTTGPQAGRVLVAGGAQRDPLTVRGTSEIYDDASGTWGSSAAMVTAREGHTATLLDVPMGPSAGKVLVAGGSDGTSTLASAELYDPETGTWSPTAPMHDARLRHTATLLPCGLVLVAGGEDDTGNAVSTVEVYDAVTGGWSVVGAMSAARATHAAALLTAGPAAGSVLVAGGVGSGGVAVASAELYPCGCAP